jgi:hypothetical protein
VFAFSVAMILSKALFVASIVLLYLEVGYIDLRM